MVGDIFKELFFRGVLFSQRSESTNAALLRRLHGTYGLFDFYSIFSNVITNWKRNERDDNARNKEGFLDIYLPIASILEHALNKNIVNIYKLFEFEYIKGEGCSQESVSSVETPTGTDYVYFVFENYDANQFAFEVRLCSDDHTVTCSYKKSSNECILCCHCLRIYNMHCVQKLPEADILKWWTRVARLISDSKVSSSNVSHLFSILRSI